MAHRGSPSGRAANTFPNYVATSSSFSPSNVYTRSLSSLHLSAAAWFPSAQLPPVSVSSSSRFEVAVFSNTGVLQQKGWAAESPFRSIHYHKKKKKTPHERLVTRRPHLFRSFIQTAVIDHSRMHWDFAQVVYMISFQRWAVDQGGNNRQS